MGGGAERDSDQGTHFLSLLLRQVYSLLGIKGTKTTPYHPKTDGLVERFNHTLKTMLRRFSLTDWKGLGRVAAIPSVCIQGGATGLHGLLAF